MYRSIDELRKVDPSELSVIRFDNKTIIGFNAGGYIRDADCRDRGVESWLLNWNTGDLSDFYPSDHSSILSRRLNKKELLEFDRVRGKLILVKENALSYWESYLYKDYPGVKD